MLDYSDVSHAALSQCASNHIQRSTALQIRTAASGLQDNSNPPNTYDIATAVSAITTLRDDLAGTAAENALTRNVVAVSGVTNTGTGPDLFASDSNAVAFTRTPTQVTAICFSQSPSVYALHISCLHTENFKSD